MNENLKKLMKQADYPAPEMALRAQKLAELIVLECAVIVGSMEEPHQDIAKLIKQHFGVEE
jgi:hypothetical protein